VMAALRGDDIVVVSLEEATAELKTVPDAWYDVARAFFGSRDREQVEPAVTRFRRYLVRICDPASSSRYASRVETAYC
jgi:hypothetical protein